MKNTDVRKALEGLLDQPQNLVDVPTAQDWERAQQKFGILPDDYMWFVKRFGSGHIDNFLFVFNPASPNPHTNLLAQVETSLSALRELHEGGTEQIPYPLFPKKNGLIPFAATDNGDVLFWVTKGTPSEWSIAVNDSRAPEWVEYPLSMTEFLYRILSKKDRCPIFPDEFPSNRPAFYPALRA